MFVGARRSSPRISAVNYCTRDTHGTLATANWTTVNMTLVTGQPDPFGGGQAISAIPTSTLGNHILQNAPSAIPAGVFCLSLYAKYNGYQWLYIGDGTSAKTFDVLNGVVGSTGSAGSPLIVPVGNGWYRCSITNTLTAGVKAPQARFYQGDNTTTFAGDTVSGQFWYGFQFEQGGSPSAYNAVL